MIAARQVLAGAFVQLRSMRAERSQLLFLALVPVQCALFLTLFRYSGRTDLNEYAVLAPSLIAVWQYSLFVSGEIIVNERDSGGLEPLLASPARLDLVVFGRLIVTTTISLLGIPLSWVTAGIVFGIWVSPHHVAVLIATVLATAAATACTALLFAVLFVRARSPRIFQNSLSYPFYVLGGVAFPITVLPAAIEPLARVVYLSWSADLLRDAMSAAEIENGPARIAAILVLGLLGYLAARVLLFTQLRRVRQEGVMGSHA